MIKYKIDNIRWAGNRWLAEVCAWQGCICECDPITVEIHQEKRPSRSVIIGAYLKFKV